MRLLFTGRCVAVYVPEVKTAARVPVTVVLSGTIYPATGAAAGVGVDPSIVNEVSGWRVTYWLPNEDVDGTTQMLKNAISTRATLEAAIQHKLVTRQRPSTKDGSKLVYVTEWLDSIDYID